MHSPRMHLKPGGLLERLEPEGDLEMSFELIVLRAVVLVLAGLGCAAIYYAGKEGRLSGLVRGVSYVMGAILAALLDVWWPIPASVVLGAIMCHLFGKKLESGRGPEATNSTRVDQ